MSQQLRQLDRSWLKAYLLGPKKRALRDRLQASLKQVRVLQRATRDLRCQPMPSNWQRLQQAWDRLDELRGKAGLCPLSLTPEADPVLPSNRLTRLWDEAQHFLAPMVVTVWGVLVKLGLLMAAIAQNVPLLVGLVSTGLMLYQRLAARITQLKTEDQTQLITICQALTVAFDKLKGKQIMENIQYTTERTLDTAAVAALAASNAAKESKEVKEGMEELKAENDKLKKTIEEQSEQLKAQGKKLDAILDLLKGKKTDLSSTTAPPRANQSSVNETA